MYDRLACGWSEVYLFEQTLHETVGMPCVSVGVLVSIFQRNRTNRIYIHIYRHNLFYCALQILSFLRSEGLWQPWVEKSVGDIFPTAFFHFMVLCHIKLSHYYICDDDLWLVIFLIFTYFIYLRGCTGSELWHAGSLAVVCRLLVVACGVWFPNQEWNSRPLSHWTTREVISELWCYYCKKIMTHWRLSY